MIDNNNRILVVADASNFEYVCIFKSINAWKRQYPEEACIIRDPRDTDQDNLPNLIVYESYRRILMKCVQDKLESINWVVRNNHPMEVDLVDGMDIVFTMDDKISNNFRRIKYPEYKAQRRLKLKQYDIFVLKDYIENVIFKELELEEKHGYMFLKVDNCESDDIVAIIMDKFKDYRCRVLLSSDRDFLQLEDVFQYSMFGETVKCGFTDETSGEFVEMSKKDYLLWKILRGDKSDNIKSVIPLLGDKRSYALVKDREKLKSMLLENQQMAENYERNRSLIDFREIPQDIRQRISESIDKAFSKRPEELKNNMDALEDIFPISEAIEV